jgi:AcrR family transcriptional regulator
MQGKREAQAARRREILLETAFKMFSERGYRRTSVRDITRGAGVTEAVLYHYFNNKADLLTAVIARYAPFARFQEILGDLGDAPVDSVLRELSTEFLKLLNARRSFVLGLLSEAASDPELGQILGGFLRGTVQGISQYLRRRQESGHINQEIDVLAAAQALQGGLLLSFLSTNLPPGPDMPEIDQQTVDNLVSVLINGLSVRPG